MDTARGLQEVVSRNVRVLMAIHDITSQKDLVARLGDGWDAPKLARTLNGNRKWALEDLPSVAEVFGLTPAALLSDTTDLVGIAAHPAVAGGDVRKGLSSFCSATDNATLIPFPPVRPNRGRYLHNAAAQTTRPATGRRHRHLRTVTPLSGSSFEIVNAVTAVVGL